MKKATYAGLTLGGVLAGAAAGITLDRMLNRTTTENVPRISYEQKGNLQGILPKDHPRDINEHLKLTGELADRIDVFLKYSGPNPTVDSMVAAMNRIGKETGKDGLDIGNKLAADALLYGGLHEGASPQQFVEALKVARAYYRSELLRSRHNQK